MNKTFIAGMIMSVPPYGHILAPFGIAIQLISLGVQLIGLGMIIFGGIKMLKGI